MSRRIPRATMDEAFRLWLQGYAYREVRDRTGMSLGAISQMIAEAKGRIPDIGELRELNLVLSKGGSTVYDAMRGGRLLDMMNKLDVGLDQLDGYVKLTERLASERGVEAERFVESALRLRKLEKGTGKTYTKIVKDFEGKVSEVKRLEEEKGKLQKEVRGLKEELTKSRANLTKIVQETKQAIATKKRLEKLGLKRVNALAKFIEDYETLGLNAQEVQKLVIWRKSLAKMGIDPDELADFIKKRGPLEKQLANLSREKSAREQKVKQLRGEHLRLWNQANALRDELLKLFSLRFALKEGRLTLPCKACRMQGVSMDLASVESAVMRGSWCSGVCVFCGQWSSYTAGEAAWHVAQLVMPAIRPTRSVAQKRGG